MYFEVVLVFSSLRDGSNSTLDQRLYPVYQSQVKEINSQTLGKTIHHGHEYTYGTRVLELANMREGIIIEDFSNPLGYTDPSLPVIPFSGVVDFNTHTEFLPINAVKILS